MTRVTTSNEDEDLAAGIVARHLGLHVVRNDDGVESSQHDFWLCDREGGHVAALEVTSYARETVESLESALGRHGRVLASNATELTWLLDLSSEARIKSLISRKRRIGKLLRSLEDAGVQTFIVGSANERDEISELGALGVSGGRGLPTADSQREVLLLGSPGVATWTGGDWTNDTMSSVAWKPDNIAKLSRADVPQRHLFTWVFFSAFEPWLELLRGIPPVEPPRLPPVVTDGWIACEELIDGEGEKVVRPTVWHCLNGQPWSVVTGR